MLMLRLEDERKEFSLQADPGLQNGDFKTMDFLKSQIFGSLSLQFENEQISSLML